MTIVLFTKDKELASENIHHGQRDHHHQKDKGENLNEI
jgi:hypothetical protein